MKRLVLQILCFYLLHNTNINITIIQTTSKSSVERVYQEYLHHLHLPVSLFLVLKSRMGLNEVEELEDMHASDSIHL